MTHRSRTTASVLRERLVERREHKMGERENQQDKTSNTKLLRANYMALMEGRNKANKECRDQQNGIATALRTRLRELKEKKRMKKQAERQNAHQDPARCDWLASVLSSGGVEVSLTESKKADDERMIMEGKLDRRGNVAKYEDYPKDVIFFRARLEDAKQQKQKRKNKKRLNQS